MFFLHNVQYAQCTFRQKFDADRRKTKWFSAIFQIMRSFDARIIAYHRKRVENVHMKKI